MVVADHSANQISVLLSTMPASFPQSTSYTTGATPWTVAIGNLNGDSVRDIVTADEDDFGNGSVSVLLGISGAPVTYGPPTTVATGISFNALALEDLNGDSISDLVTLTGLPGVWVRLGTGTGGFGAPAFYTAGPTLPDPWGVLAILVRDMDGDSRPDIVTANSSASVSVLLGTGTGSFAPGQAYDLGATPWVGFPTMASGDLNEDGVQDLVVLTHAPGFHFFVSVLLGTGSGALGPPTITTLPSGTLAECVALGDLNRDGHADLLLGIYEADGLHVDLALGTGTGTFGVASSVSSGGDLVTVADVNADTKVDLVLPGSADGVNVLLNADPDMSGIPWTHLGHGLAGTGGQTPILAGAGFLKVGSPTLISVANTQPNSLLFLFTGIGAEFTPFKGGVMVPAPALRVGPYHTNALGRLDMFFSWKWPGLKICFQAWIQDAGAPMGWSATNGLQLAAQ